MGGMGRSITLEPPLILWLSLLWFCRRDIVLPFLLAVTLHELGHFLALSLMGRPPKAVILGFSGASMETALLSYGQSALAAAAGPAVSLLLSLWSPVWPELGLYSLVLGLFNLLPIPGLDGDRVLSSLLLLWLPEAQAGKITRYLGLLTALGLWGWAVYLSGPGGLGLWPLALAALVMYKALSMCAG